MLIELPIVGSMISAAIGFPSSGKYMGSVSAHYQSCGVLYHGVMSGHPLPVQNDLFIRIHVSSGAIAQLRPET